MTPRTVLLFDPACAARCREVLAPRGLEVLAAPAPEWLAAPDPTRWQRAVSELALFNWVLLPSAPAAEALIEACGAPPGRTQRVAATPPAAAVLRRAGREVEVEADGLRSLLERLADHLGRRQRVFVPHAGVAGRRLPAWLERLGAEVVARAAYDLRLGQAFTPSSDSAAPRAVCLYSPSDAESLAACLRDGLLPPATPVAALGQPAIDAAEDCGLHVRTLGGEAPEDALGPFLDEALS